MLACDFFDFCFHVDGFARFGRLDAPVIGEIEREFFLALEIFDEKVANAFVGAPDNWRILEGAVFAAAVIAVIIDRDAEFLRGVDRFIVKAKIDDARAMRIGQIYFVGDAFG